jgi:hypothetical protein
MSNLEQALAQAAEYLDSAAIPYMLIGGLAMAAWAMPRATLDVDLTLWLPEDGFLPTVTALAKRYVPRVADPGEFAVRTRVLPVESSNGARIDFLFAAFPFERAMIERAVRRSLGDVTIPVASLEDLVLLKLPSSRQKDAADVELILATHGADLDWRYLSGIAAELAGTLEQPDMLGPLRPWLVGYPN